MKKIIGIILTVFGGFGILFALIFGLVFGGLGMGFSEAAKSDQDYISDGYASCMGTIVSTEGSGDYTSGPSSKTTITYTVDGLEYQGTLNIYSSSYVKGDAVTVYYDLSNPNHFEVPEISEAAFGTMSAVFSGVGIIFAVLFGFVGIILLIVGVILIRSAKKDSISNE